MASLTGSGSACTWEWAPNAVRKCFAVSACKPVMIDRGDSVCDTPPAGVKKFNHITENFTACKN
jgi:hypothetical protein